MGETLMMMMMMMVVVVATMMLMMMMMITMMMMMVAEDDAGRSLGLIYIVVKHLISYCRSFSELKISLTVD